MNKIIIFLVLLANIQAVNALEIMPDDRLYPLDRAIENIQLKILLTSEAKAKKNFELAEERLQEIQAMVIENKIETAQRVQEIHDTHMAGIEDSMENMDQDDIAGIKERLQAHEQQIIGLTEIINREKISINARNNIEAIISEMSTRTGMASSEAQSEINEQIGLAKGWLTDDKIDELLENINSWDFVKPHIEENEGETAVVRIQEDGKDSQTFGFRVLEGTLVRCDCFSTDEYTIDKEDVKEIVDAVDRQSVTRLTKIAIDKYGVTRDQIEEAVYRRGE